MMGSLSEVEPQKWERESSEVIGWFLDSQRTLLVSQQLAAYRESILLVVKYQQELRKKGSQLT